MSSYLGNAVILTGSGLLLRAAGMGLRVYMAGLLGSEGMGLYQLIFTMYGLSIALATSGVSVAAARLTAEQISGPHVSTVPAAMARVLLAAGGLGMTACGLQLALAKPAARWWLGDERAALPLLILAGSLPFMALGAAMRGYFLARRRVSPNVQAQLLEQTVRIALIARFLPAAAGQGLAQGCAAVVLGNLVSEVVSCLCMAFFYRCDVRRQFGPGPYPHLEKIGRRLWRILAPLEASRCLTSSLSAAENVLVPLCLTISMGQRHRALAAYGALKGMALPVMFFPFSFLNTLSTLLMPEVTRAYIRRDGEQLNRLLDRMMQLTGTVAVLAGGLFTQYAQPLAQLLYHDEEVGLYIRILGPVMPFLYLESMVDGVLKGMDEQISTFKYSTWDSVLRIAAIMILLPRFGMMGFLFVMICSNLFTCGLNVRCMQRTAQLHPHWCRWLLAPVGAFALSAWAVQCAMARAALDGAKWQLAVGCTATAGVYLLLLLPLGLHRLAVQLFCGRKRGQPEASCP